MSENNESKENQQRQYDEDQYKMLLRCSEKRDMTEWNEWRKSNPQAPVHLKKVDLFEAHLEDAELFEANLEGAMLIKANLEGAILFEAHLEDAELNEAHLEGANLIKARLEGANLFKAHLENAELFEANLKGAIFIGACLEGANIGRANMENTNFSIAILDGKTIIWDCTISEETDFTATGLDSARIKPILKERLKGNIRKIQWMDYWRAKRFMRLPVWLFWQISDYGRSTTQIAKWFIASALYFALLYYVLCLGDYYYFSDTSDPGIISGLFMFEHGPIDYLTLMIRSVYFSIVTMTTLGFGDMKAYPYSNWGHICLIFQVLLGYVLLGALVTRFAVLFTSSGPSKD